MKKSAVIALSIAIVLMTVFMAVGYASLTDDLRIEGVANLEGRPPKGVYIKHVEVVNTSNANSIGMDFVLPTNLKTAVDATRSGGSVTYRITFHNNTDITYWYVDTLFTDNYENNSLLGSSNGVTVTTKDQLGDSYGTFDSNDWIPPQTEREVYVTYNYGSNAQSECRTMVNFHFDIRIDGVHDEFLAVLNNVFSPTSYEEFKAVFESVNSTSGETTISTQSHPEVFEKFFADLVVDIDGTEKQANVVIRRENLDKDTTTGDNYNGSGPDGCEYTLYITVNDLTPGTKPTVYAIAYSRGASGMGDQWYQVGELYEGTAPINADGTINYEQWIATPKVYQVADGISYKVAQPNGDQYDIMKTLEQLISAEDQNIFNTIDNTNIFKKTYDIIQKHKDADHPAIDGLRVAFSEAAHFYNNFNNGQEFKVVRGKYTRAEIIHALKKIQSALDYYYQTFPQ